MKVVHVNTHDSGGAAAAAHRLHCGLLAEGIDSKFLVLYNSGKFSDSLTFVPRKTTFLFKKIKRRIAEMPDQVIREFLSRQKNLETFTSPDTFYDLASDPHIRDADIIHLHWIANFVDYSTFFSVIRKPVVWTFHDENPLMGGCHYSEDKKFLSPTMSILDEEFQKMKMRSLNRLERLEIICPSHWMQRSVAASFLSPRKSETIFYGLSETDWQLIDRRSARRELNIPDGSAVYSVVATDLTTYRKGFDIVMNVLSAIAEDPAAVVLLVGNPPGVPLPPVIVPLGTISDHHRLNLIYAASDAVLFPSRQDNLPNVLLESIFCGTPALAFAVGGITDIIQHGVNGLLSGDVSISSFRKMLDVFRATKDTFDRATIRAHALQKFASKNEVAGAIRVYTSSGTPGRTS